MEAAEHDAVGVEQVDQPGQADTEPVRDLLGRGRGARVGGGGGEDPAGRGLESPRGRRPAAVSTATGSASTSRQPRLPQWQRRPPGSTVRWPTYLLVPCISSSG